MSHHSQLVPCRGWTSHFVVNPSFPMWRCNCFQGLWHNEKESWMHTIWLMKLQDFVFFLFFQVPSGIQLYIMFFYFEFLLFDLQGWWYTIPKIPIRKEDSMLRNHRFGHENSDFRRGELFFDPLLFRGWMTMLYKDIWYTSWWFQIFFIFTPTWGNDPIWLIFFNWVETTN